MKGNKLKTIYFISIAALILTLVILFIKKEVKKREYSYFPEFSFKEIDGYINSTKNLPTSEKYVILIFNPGCKGCQAEAEIILNNINSFDETTLLFLSPDSISRIEDFMIEQSLYGKDNIYYGQVSIDTIEIKLGKSAIPWSFVYDSNKKLLSSGLALKVVDIEKYFSQRSKSNQ